MEVLNERLLYPSYEIIGGEKIMSPAANLDHSGIIMRLGMIIGTHLANNKSGYVYPDDVDVHFSDGSLYKPDLVVVLKSNEKILAGQQNIYGAPDMVVEVLSKSTKKRMSPLKRTLTSRKACANIGLLTRGLKAFRFIFCAMANIISTMSIFFSMIKSWNY